jgi:hemerythrin-like domain-containing protein
MTKIEGRREFLMGVGATGVVLTSFSARGAAEKKGSGKAQEIPPTEDLMREHGVLRRLLLVYDEAARRLPADDAVVSVVGSAAGIVGRFVEGYHEKLEEQFVLPRLEKAGKLVDLAKVIRAQHAAGRKLTESISKNSKAGKSASTAQRRTIVADIRAFGRMYAAHAAWEDTEIFPAYRSMFTEVELDELGDQFEEQEHKLLGSSGFEGSLNEVGDLEKALGIHDLATYTPRA